MAKTAMKIKQQRKQKFSTVSAVSASVNWLTKVRSRA